MTPTADQLDRLVASFADPPLYEITPAMESALKVLPELRAHIVKVKPKYLVQSVLQSLRTD